MDAVLIAVQKGLSSSNCGIRVRHDKEGENFRKWLKKQVF